MMIRYGTLGVLSSCIVASYTGRVVGIASIHYAIQRESVSHCLPTAHSIGWAMPSKGISAMKQFGFVIILCVFGIVLVVILIGIFSTINNFEHTFQASESALSDFVVFFLMVLKYGLAVAAILGTIWASIEVYWRTHRKLIPTPEGNYPVLVSPIRKNPLLLSPGNGPVPNSFHNHQENNYSEPKQIAGTTVQQLPSAPSFAQIGHLITPERLILNYIESGPVYGEVDDLLSMALIGKPKRGKTTALLYYLCILLKADAEVWIWDPHGEMSELAYGLHYFSDLDDIAASAVDLLAELDERGQIYKETKKKKHPLVLLVDEIPVITDWERDMKKQKREIPASPYRVMKRFTLEARKWRGFVFISGQSLPADVLPTLTRDNLSSRLVLECSTNHARMIGLPKETIDTLLPLLKGAERGTHIADFSSWSHPELADIPYTTIDDLRAIIDGRETDVSTWETPIEANATIIDSVFPVSRENTTSSVKVTAMVGNDIRETVKRMHRKGIPLRDIANFVGLSGRKYHIFQEVCKEENIMEQMENEA